jgi:glyoxylase-like metal-dependent hydrolase (beta-lactamase superfamily II)
MLMTTLRLGEPIDPRIPWVRKIHDLDTARSTAVTGTRQRELERAGRALGNALRDGPKVISVRTLPTSDAPYPVRFAFNGAVPTLAPGAMLVIRNRSLLVQVETEHGIKNVLFNPTDGPANQRTPFYARLSANTPARLRRVFEPKPNQCAEQLAALGLSCADIDVIAFDHFHTQDVRPLVGTSTSAPRFPNALLLAPRVEWTDWDDLPMIQRAWFVPDGKTDVVRDRVVLTDADLALGGGLLLLRTPGHTTGNQTLFVRDEIGVFGCSENGTCADNWSPHHSSLPGMKRAARLLDFEVVLNANTPELAAEQYTSMLLERAMVDRVPGRPEFCRMFPSSEVTKSIIAPHVKPTLTFGHMDSGTVVSKRAAPPVPVGARVAAE